jgi:xylan 1,4-beta-xylosidase
VTEEAGGLAGAGAGGPGGSPRRFRNPVIPGFHPDPSVCRIGPDFFLVTSSFEYFPAIPLFHSRDLVSWRHIGYCLDRPGQVDLSAAPSSGGIYAPTIRHHQGTTYVTATNVTGGGHFIVSTQDPFGPWSEPVWVAQDGIDPSLFFEDGAAYLSSTVEPDPGGPHPARPSFQRGIQQSRIDVATGALLDGPRLVWTGTGGQYPEAPHLLRRGEFYYLMIAEGGTEYGHMVTIARARSPWGPFTPSPGNPVLTHRSTNSPFQAVGHADLVELADGSWWLVCLGVRPRGQWPCHHLGRETFLAPVTWTADGWLRVGQRGLVEETGPGPALPPAAAGGGPAEPVGLDHFDAPALGLAWNFLRVPRPERWSLSARPGWLRLACGAPDLDDLDVVFTGRRQEHLHCRASGLVELDARSPAAESGLVARMNERHHYEVAVTGTGSGQQVIARLRIGPLSQQVASRPVPPGAVELWIEATPDEYRLGYTVPGGPGELLGTAPTRYLSSEVAGGFTGVFLGLYATGLGHPAAGSADWDWFRYQAGP